MLGVQPCLEMDLGVSSIGVTGGGPRGSLGRNRSRKKGRGEVEGASPQRVRGAGGERRVMAASQKKGPGAALTEAGNW